MHMVWRLLTALVCLTTSSALSSSERCITRFELAVVNSTSRSFVLAPDDQVDVHLALTGLTEACSTVPNVTHFSVVVVFAEVSNGKPGLPPIVPEHIRVSYSDVDGTSFHFYKPVRSGANNTVGRFMVNTSALIFDTNHSRAFTVDSSEAKFRVEVIHSRSVQYVCSIVGLVYTLVWSISFYPQTWINYRRKSVVGLSFDFVALNFVGFVLYSVFNIAFLALPEVMVWYAAKNPNAWVNPVQWNDALFSLHGVFACSLTILQCYIYERGDQRVSAVGKTILSVVALLLLLSAVSVSVGDKLNIASNVDSHSGWLIFLYICSYCKLVVTFAKYIPQAYYNYRRQSTEGWSIGNILLDLIGGILSILQMLLLAYNYGDWYVMTIGDPTKLGLGMLSIAFDAIFIYQHYCLYNIQLHLTDSDETETSVVRYDDLSERINPFDVEAEQMSHQDDGRSTILTASPSSQQSLSSSVSSLGR